MADLHPSIASVTQSADGDSLDFVLDQDEPLYDASALTDLAKAALVISAGMKDHYPDAPGSRVRFIARLPVVGLERFVTEVRVLGLTFRRAELMKLDYGDGLRFQDLLNMAEGVEYGEPDDKRLLVGFCGDPSARAAGTFCERELSRGRPERR